tara:strand:- start:85 stop:2010 length:1926 start_codon:yes stop_codon:yes gene_type:complete
MALVVITVLASPAIANSQVSPEEHAKHHPNQKNSVESNAETNDTPAGSGGMMGGPGGGMMDGMMEKMGAPKPKNLYPSLMQLPDLPFERRGELEQKAHERMVAGVQAMNTGFAELTDKTAIQDFNAMQLATAMIRAGLTDFESGLATHQALREGKAPRNVAMQWFKQELNLSDQVRTSSNAIFWGMSAFHASVMLVLVLFAIAMIWMYYFKMRRASQLLEKLMAADSSESLDHKTVETSVDEAAANKSSETIKRTIVRENKQENSDCCNDAEDDCPTKTLPTDFEISEGVLSVAKKKLCQLRVARIIQETGDVKTFRLVACHGGSIPFSYLPGQFLTITLPVTEKPIRRSYTISSSPTQGYFCEVTVKREEQGAGSRYLHDHVTVGDTLEVKAPSGRFTFSGQEANDIVLISGGVGITPMMSIVRALTDMCWDGEIDFIIACRDPEHFIFESELNRLQEQYENLHLHVAMSRIDQDIDDYRSGRLNKEMLLEWVPDIAAKRIHICGAPAMMEATKAMLADLNVPEASIHTENFGSTQKPKAIVAEGQEVHQPEPTGYNVSFVTSDKSVTLQQNETILEAAERIDVDLDYSCRVGTCGICVAKLLSGEVSMEVEDGLEPEDKQAGKILTCQAIAKQDVSIEA